MSNKIAVILLRGVKIGVDVEIRRALDLLRLKKKFVVAIVEASPSTKGALQKVKDYVAFGEVSAEVVTALEKNRKRLSPDDAKIISYSLHPPRGGLEKRGVKAAYTQGGSLGNRKEKINDLLMRMM